MNLALNDILSSDIQLLEKVDNAVFSGSKDGAALEDFFTVDQHFIQQRF